MDVELVEQARLGDRGAYEQLAAIAARRLYPVALHLLRERDAADDAVQQTLVVTWKELPRLRDASKFDAWSHRILVRFCLRELGRRHAGISPCLDDLARPDHEGAFERVALLDELDRGLKRISTVHRVVLVLVYVNGLSEAEAAEELGVPTGTVASRLHYARKQLRAALEADARLIPPVASVWAQRSTRAGATPRLT